MGSVIDYIECVNCKAEAYSDFYYKTGEEYINCNNCGYHYSATIINREKRLDELTDKDWKVQECKKPYGSYRLKYVEDVGTVCGGLKSKAEWKMLKEEVMKDTSQIEYFQLSRFTRGEILVEYLI